MMLLRLLFTAGFLASVISSPGAQEAKQTVVRVPPGAETRLAGYNLTRQVNGQCAGGGLPTITIVTPPTAGKADVRVAPVQITQVLSGKDTCLGKSFDGSIVAYKAPENFTGEDKLSIEVNFGAKHPLHRVNYLIKADPTARTRDPMTNAIQAKLKRVVFGSMESVLARFNRLAADCKPAAPPQIKVLNAPASGSLRFAEGEVGSWRAAAGTQPRCVDVTVPSRDIFYTAKAGTSGRDTFRVEVRFDNGEVWDASFDVDIR